MTTHFDQTRVPLDRTLFLRIAHGTGATITCMQGCLWVTRDGSSKDTVLAPGQSYQVVDSTRVIVTGIGPSLAQVRRPTAPRRPAARRPLAALLPAWTRRLAAA